MVKSKGTKAADLVIAFICVLLIIACLLPVLNIVARSLSSSEALIKGQVLLWPKGWNFTAYKLVLGDSKYTWSLGWTAILTVICTFVSWYLNIMCIPLICENSKAGGFSTR